MQLFPTGYNPKPGALLVCRHTSWGPAFFHFGALAFMLVLGIKLLLELGSGIQPEFNETIVPLAVSGLIAFLSYGHSGFMIRPENWTLALHAGGLWINLRQPYPKLPRPAESVAHLSYEELHSAREHRLTYYRKTSDDKTRDTACYVDLLVSEEVSDTVWLILEEIGNPSAWVTVPTPGVIRIETDKEGFHLRPGRERVLAELGEFVSVDESDRQDDTQLGG